MRQTLQSREPQFLGQGVDSGMTKQLLSSVFLAVGVGGLLFADLIVPSVLILEKITKSFHVLGREFDASLDEDRKTISERLIRFFFLLWMLDTTKIETYWA